MSERAEVQLSASFHFEPERLVVARQRLPLDHRDYVPLMIFNRSFSMVEPTLTSLGGGAVAMSIGRPFGFMQGIDNNRIMQETQRTDGIILAPDPDEQGKWLATFDTPDPLSGLDLGLFSYGVSFYAAHAEAKLNKTS